MKIGLVCPYDLFKGGGVQECVWAMQAELTRRGYKVLIIAPKLKNRPEELPEFIRLLGAGTDFKSPFHTTAQVSVSVDTNEVDELLASEKFDILHFHEPWVPLLSRQLLMRSKAKNIATFHAKLPDTVMSRTIERVITPYTKSLLKYFSAMTAVSDSAADYVRSLTSETIHIVPNGIDLKKYRPAKVKSKSKYIFFIGRLERRKGIKYLLKAAEVLQASHPEVSLLIAGDGPDREQLEDYAHEHNVDAEFLGKLDEETKLGLLAGSAVFCSPARYGESFGIVLLEAMASGVPIVAGDNPGYAAVMKETGQVSLVNPADTEQFVRRIELMLHDKAIRKVWQAWAAQEVKQYDYKKIVDRYAELYGKA